MTHFEQKLNTLSYCKTRRSALALGMTSLTGCGRGRKFSNVDKQSTDQLSRSKAIRPQENAVIELVKYGRNCVFDQTCQSGDSSELRARARHDVPGLGSVNAGATRPLNMWSQRHFNWFWDSHRASPQWGQEHQGCEGFPLTGSSIAGSRSRWRYGSTARPKVTEHFPRFHPGPNGRSNNGTPNKEQEHK